jgi:hypothetical protein
VDSMVYPEMWLEIELNEEQVKEAHAMISSE